MGGVGRNRSAKGQAVRPGGGRSVTEMQDFMFACELQVSGVINGPIKY